jgi:hypothetical protein
MTSHRLEFKFEKLQQMMLKIQYVFYDAIDVLNNIGMNLVEWLQTYQLSS